MKTLSVVILFFQRDLGLMGKTLQAIEDKAIPQGWQLQAFLVLAKADFLSANNRTLNDGGIRIFTGEFIFNSVRDFLEKFKKATPKDLHFIKKDVSKSITLFAGFSQAIVGKLLEKAAPAKTD